MGAIPANQFVTVVPSVLAAGGGSISLNGLLLTTSTRPPIGQVLSFNSLLAVQTYFGAGSTEAAKAAVYFQGFSTSTIKPSAYLIAQYPWTSPVAAYLRGGNPGLTLAQLQALTGTIIITVDGVAHTSGTINLSSATSFSSAATIITTGLAASDASVTGSISATNLTVSAVASGTLAPGQVINGTGVTVGTTIVSQASGTTGGVGVYVVSASQTVSSTTITAGAVTCSYDSISSSFVITAGSVGAASTIGFATGTLATSLALTAATGAVTSQGAAIAVPGTFMAALISTNQQWFSFATTFEPVTSDKVLFGAWVNSTTGGFAYVMGDSDATVASGTSTTCAGYLMAQAAYNGIIPIYSPSDLNHANFVQGAIASINFGATNGRITLAYKSQAGLVPGVTDTVTLGNVLANGYNCYLAEASSASANNYFWIGSMIGAFKWADTYTDQAWLNSSIQNALISFLTSVNSVPYNVTGYGWIYDVIVGPPVTKTNAGGPVSAAINAGVIRAGIPLSSSQVANVNGDAGFNVATTISQQGYYLLIQPASAAVRVARGSPPITLWYCDGESIQTLSIASIVVQ